MMIFIRYATKGGVASNGKEIDLGGNSPRVRFDASNGSQKKTKPIPSMGLVYLPT